MKGVFPTLDTGSDHFSQLTLTFEPKSMSTGTDTQNCQPDTGHSTKPDTGRSYCQVDSGHYRKFQVDTRRRDPPSWPYKRWICCFDQFRGKFPCYILLKCMFLHSTPHGIAWNSNWGLLFNLEFQYKLVFNLECQEWFRSSVICLTKCTFFGQAH